MKRIFFIFSCFLCQTVCFAQTIEKPIFDRSDVPEFRVEKVEITPDTTYVYCSYCAEENSWVCLSEGTYLEDVKDGTKYSIINVSGIPFSPQQRNFTSAAEIQVVMSFPHISAEKINIIENDDNESFNIYGIDLKNSYKRSYTDTDVDTYYQSAMDNEKKENWNAAITQLLKQLEASEYVYGIRSKEVSWPMYSLTMQYAGLGNYEKMIEWGKRAIDILKVLPPDSLNLDVLARAYGNVGSAYAFLKQPNAASQYRELSLAIRRQKDGVGVLNFEEYLMVMAVNYYYEGNYPKALLYGKEFVDIFERKFYENRNKYGCAFIHSLTNLCEFYQGMDLYDDASKVGRKAVDLISEREGCEDIPWLKYAVYTKLAGALSMTGQVDEGIGYLEKIINETDSLNNGFETVIDETKMLYANLLLDYKQDTLKAINYYESILEKIEDRVAADKGLYPECSEILRRLYKVYIRKDKNIGLNYLRRTIQVQKEWQGEETVLYANLLLEYVDNTFVETISKKENTDTIFNYLYNASKIIKRHINNTIYNMSKSDREVYWNRYRKLFTWLIPVISHFIQADEWSSMAYDASLFNKGMLLSSETEFKNVVLSSNDSILIDQFTDYIRDLSLLEAHYTGYNSLSDTDSLTSEIKRKEYILSQKVSRFNKQNKGTNYSWEEVKNHLKEGDVAIEIVSYDLNTTTYYDAYIIKPSSPSPRLISLFNDEGKLSNQVRNNSIDYKRLSMFIWGNNELKEELNGVKNIYFSASGLLNSIGIEYLPIGDDQYIFDKYNLYRVSSTRELCYDNSFKITTGNACLFGGLDYNIAKQSVKNENSTNYRLVFRTVEDSIAKRSGFEPLIGSKDEIEQIKKEIGNKIRYAVFTDSEGTEESFKKMSGNNINIIHLSTHGMYIPDDDNQVVNNNFHFVLSDELPNIDEETQALTRSFLVMSGGNMIIQRDSISEGEEDGILTALEISHLDFTDLDLVVLSACQTALGHVSSDGIYGLQRGFKKAGANTIIMSLDKVDDEATKIMMVEFYKNLMIGKTKLQSLREAQKYLRQVDNGKYDKPKYWASFIMLDGLN